MLPVRGVSFKGLQHISGDPQIDNNIRLFTFYNRFCVLETEAVDIGYGLKLLREIGFQESSKRVMQHYRRVLLFTASPLNRKPVPREISILGYLKEGLHPLFLAGPALIVHHDIRSIFCKKIPVAGAENHKPRW